MEDTMYAGTQSYTTSGRHNACRNRGTPLVEDTMYADTVTPLVEDTIYAGTELHHNWKTQCMQAQSYTTNGRHNVCRHRGTPLVEDTMYAGTELQN